MQQLRSKSVYIHLKRYHKIKINLKENVLG